MSDRPGRTEPRSRRRPRAAGAAAAGLAVVVSIAAAVAAMQVTGHEPVVGGPCDGCEAVFQGIPEELSSEARIAPADEPGEPLRITGTVVGPDGEPAPGTVVYAYHTDAEGIYPPNEEFPGRAAYRHGELRGWAVADAEGRYRFDTIRPAGYPNSRVAQHVHMHVIEPGRCTYWIDSIHFTDDPRFAGDGGGNDDARGGSGVVTPERGPDGTWRIERDILLGRGVPGYAACARELP